MKRDSQHSWKRGHGPTVCVKCGQLFLAFHATRHCVCWKMRLPKRKEK